MRISLGAVGRIRVPFPASRGALRLRFCFVDNAWAFVSPPVALYLSGRYVLDFGEGYQTAALYCFTSFAFSAIAFLIFRVQDGMARYFSVYDALGVCKAVIATELMTCLALFNLTRLEGIPRSTLIIHSLIFGAGLIAVRTLVRILTEERADIHVGKFDPEHIIMIGSTRLSSLYIKLLQACAPNQRRVVAVLDGRREVVGRTIEGVQIIGAPHDLDTVIHEYSIHGIQIGRVIVGGESNILSEVEMKEVCRTCEQRQILLNFVPELVGLRDLKDRREDITPQEKYSKPIVLSAYFQWKRLIDFCVASIIIIVFIPLLVSVGLVALFNVGSPVLFWQRRVGFCGRSFLLYKFRTLRAPFDWRGDPTLPDERLSRIGRLLRETSLDELPQLLNVWVGDMSLIGPRPLLPEDQPEGTSVRLMVRPGITGWAQVNGGKLLTPEQKDKLDEWYILNASIWLDLRIILRTLQMLVSAGRSKEASVDARRAGVALPEHAESMSAGIDRPQSVQFRSIPL
jgi:lipopolysaccharide/colanic/teichoic acid biosynthesis glycosyltransferase